VPAASASASRRNWDPLASTRAFSRAKTAGKFDEPALDQLTLLVHDIEPKLSNEIYNAQSDLQRRRSMAHKSPGRIEVLAMSRRRKHGKRDRRRTTARGRPRFGRHITQLVEADASTMKTARYFVHQEATNAGRNYRRA
jgi:hypothetical protein